MNLIAVLTFLGLILSVYALYVERNRIRRSNYKPVCDISKKISCTKVFTSRYGQLIGVSNSFIGLLFYASIFILHFNGYDYLVFILALASVIGSFYLAYIQYFKLKTLCVVCTAIYIINIILLFASYTLM